MLHVQATIQQAHDDTQSLRHELPAAVMLLELIVKEKKYKREKSSSLPHYHFDTSTVDFSTALLLCTSPEP